VTGPLPGRGKIVVNYQVLSTVKKSPDHIERQPGGTTIFATSNNHGPSGRLSRENHKYSREHLERYCRSLYEKTTVQTVTFSAYRTVLGG
jgi:hypothetical protein